MEGTGPPTSPPPPPPDAAVISAVLGDDDLLGEILLRVAFPTTLVRAALVCKRWLRRASDPAFLRDFRDLHPPRLLGFYVTTFGIDLPRFLPMPQPPELAAVARRAGFDLGSLGRHVHFPDCWNGRLHITLYAQDPCVDMVRYPLYPARGAVTLPPLPDTSVRYGVGYNCHDILPRGGANDLSYLCLAMGSKAQQTIADLYALQDGVWEIHSSAETTDIPAASMGIMTPALLADTKIYTVAYVSNIYMLVWFDMASSSLSVVKLPEVVEHCSSFKLSLADDCGVHLIHVKDLQLRIWLYKMSSWLLVDTICLSKISVDQRMPTCTFEDGNSSAVLVHAVVNAKFVVLEMASVLYLFDVKSKAAKKVYEVTLEDKPLGCVCPFMMIWPPKFPVRSQTITLQGT